MERSEVAVAAVSSRVPKLERGPSEHPSGPSLRPARPGLFTSVLNGLWGRRFICKYFAQLELEYDALCPHDYRVQTALVVAGLRAEHRERPGWDLNHRFEHVLMAGIHAETLESRLQIYRERLQDLAGPERAQAMAAAFAGVPADAKDAEQAERTLALGMLAEIQRLRHVRSEFEHLRNRLLVSLLCGGALFGVIVRNLLVMEGELPTIPLHVAAAGLLGGYFSVLLRLGALRWCPEFNANYHQVDRLFWNVLSSFVLAMFEGAVAAFVLYAVFLAGLVDGSLFPSFDAQAFSDPNLSHLFWIAPTQTGDAAKLIVWSILAGFSERMIPDILSSFAKRLERGPETQAAAPARGG